MERTPEDHEQICRLVQEQASHTWSAVYIKVVQGLQQLRLLEKPLEHYVRSVAKWVARRECQNVRRAGGLVRAPRGTVVELLSPINESQAAQQLDLGRTDPAEIAARKEQAELVQRCLRGLSPRRRQALIAWSQGAERELSSRLGCTRNNVYQLRERGLRELRAAVRSREVHRADD